MKNSPAGLKMSLLDPQLFHGIFVQNVDVAAAIYQNSRKPSSSLFSGKGGIQNQGVGTGIGHHHRVVGSAPVDGILRPMHELEGL